MTAALALLAAALAPLIPLPMVNGRLVAHARSLWLLGVLTLGIVWLASVELWLALLGLWFLIRWTREAEPMTLLPSILQWAGVGASWALLRQIPPPWFAVLPWAWLAIAAWETGWLVARRVKLGGRQRGNFGSPAITALYLALCAPFCPWWGWPVLAVGLGLTSSFLALGAIGVGMVWLWPGTWLYGALAALTGALLWCWSPEVGGQRLLEWTPRGDTIDSLVSRGRGWQLILHHGRARWLLGAGPNTMEPSLLAWGSRYDMELCWGEGFNEVLHVYYEYGLLGVAALAAFAWRVASHVAFGDPWSAAWVVGIVLSLAHWPMRHPSIGLVWLAISARIVQ